MKRLNRERGVTFVFSSHDPRVLAAASRLVCLEDGRVCA
jgi:putative ABC transport system ATP-binding protein